jgi:hypothetical protein
MRGALAGIWIAREQSLNRLLLVLTQLAIYISEQ